MDEIKNKIQLEIINITKTIAMQRRGTESREKKKLEKNKVNRCKKPDRTTMQTLSKEKENDKINQMMR